MDRIQLVAVASALVLDVMVLGAMVGRIGDLGFTPNRTVARSASTSCCSSNLAGTAWLSARFLTGRSAYPPPRAVADGLPAVFALWAAAVVVDLAPLFAFD